MKLVPFYETLRIVYRNTVIIINVPNNDLNINLLCKK